MLLVRIRWEGSGLLAECLSVKCEEGKACLGCGCSTVLRSTGCFMELLGSGIQSCRCGLRTSTLGIQYQNLSRLVCSDGKDGLCMIRGAEEVRIAGTSRSGETRGAWGIARRLLQKHRREVRRVRVAGGSSRAGQMEGRRPVTCSPDTNVAPSLTFIHCGGDAYTRQIWERGGHFLKVPA